MPASDAAMTFEEIGHKLGVSNQRAEQIYQAALAKLKANPQALEMLLLAKSKEHVNL